MADDLYRLAPGHIAPADVLAESAYLVANWPYATPGAAWSVQTDGIIVPYAQRTRTPTGKNYGLGSPRTSWGLAPVNRAQVEWFIDTYTGGALSAPVTLYSWRFNNMSASGDARDWLFAEAILELPDAAALDNVNDIWNRTFEVLFTRMTFLAPPED